MIIYETCYFFIVMETTYSELKTQILALATSFYDGDKAAKERLQRTADFYPRVNRGGKSKSLRSMVIRVRGELFLVEDTKGGEMGVFSLLLPLM